MPRDSPADASSPDKLTIELLSSELQELKAAHEEKLGEIKSLEEKPLRLQAEFENYKKRQVREREVSRRSANEDLLRAMLPVLDNLERAVEHGE